MTIPEKFEILSLLRRGLCYASAGVLVVLVGPIITLPLEPLEAKFAILAASILVILFLDLLRFAAALEAGEHYSARKAVVLYSWGMTVSFVRSVYERREKLAADARRVLNQPQHLKARNNYLWALKCGYIVEVAWWLCLVRELEDINELELRDRQSGRTKRMLRQTERGLNTLYRAGNSAVAQPASSWTMRIRADEARLKTLLVSLPGSYPDIETRIESLPHLAHHGRSYRLAVREIERMIDLVTPAKEVPVATPTRTPATSEPPTASPILSRDRLPERYRWWNEVGVIVYAPSFHRLLGRFSLEEQRQFMNSLWLLAEQGMYYRSLYTRHLTYRPVPQTPRNCYVSRASRELRFSYDKEDGRVTCYGAFYRRELKGVYLKTS